MPVKCPSGRCRARSSTGPPRPQPRSANRTQGLFLFFDSVAVLPLPASSCLVLFEVSPFPASCGRSAANAARVRGLLRYKGTPPRALFQKTRTRSTNRTRKIHSDTCHGQAKASAEGKTSWIGIHHWASPKRVPKTAAPIPCSASKAINGGLIPVPAASPKADPKITAPVANWAASALNSGHRGLGIPDPAVGALVEQ